MGETVTKDGEFDGRGGAQLDETDLGLPIGRSVENEQCTDRQGGGDGRREHQVPTSGSPSRTQSLGTNRPTNPLPGPSRRLRRRSTDERTDGGCEQTSWTRQRIGAERRRGRSSQLGHQRATILELRDGALVDQLQEGGGGQPLRQRRPLTQGARQHLGREHMTSATCAADDVICSQRGLGIDRRSPTRAFEVGLQARSARRGNDRTQPSDGIVRGHPTPPTASGPAPRSSCGNFVRTTCSSARCARANRDFTVPSDRLRVTASSS